MECLLVAGESSSIVRLTPASPCIRLSKNASSPLYLRCAKRTAACGVRGAFVKPASQVVQASRRRNLGSFRPLRSVQADAQSVSEEAKNVEVQESEPAAAGDANTATAAEEEVSPSNKTEELLSVLAGAGLSEAVLEDVKSTLQSWETELNTQREQMMGLQEEVVLGKDRLLRLNADFDNYRKRSEKEKAAIATTVRGEVVEELLPMVDNFERAKGQLKLETEGEQKVDASYQGIYKQFVEIMKALGVRPIDTVGKPFDFNVHEAIMREESMEYAENIVIQEFRRGFTIGDKLLRPAMVKVSQGPGPSSPAAAEAAAQPPQEEAAKDVAEKEEA